MIEFKVFGTGQAYLSAAIFGEVRMASQDFTSAQPAVRTAVTVMNAGSAPALCPFFGKCEGVMIIDSRTNARVFHPNPERTAVSLCALIVKEAPERLICGFIAGPERDKLRENGIEVRIGSCSCSIDELTACFCDLPEP